MRIKIGVAAASLLLAVPVVGVPPASAAVKRFEGHIRITSVDTTYDESFGYVTYVDGAVKSQKPACVRNRRVKVEGLYRGRWFDPGSRATTDRRGHWEFQSQVNGIVGASKLRAKVLRKRLHSGNVCQADRSSVVKAPPKR